MSAAVVLGVHLAIGTDLERYFADHPVAGAQPTPEWRDGSLVSDDGRRACRACGGLLALINLAAASVATTTLAGWNALLVVAGFQGWAAWKSESTTARIRAGLIAVAALFLGLSLLLGPFGDGSLMRMLVGLFADRLGRGEVLGRRAMRGAPNFPLVLGTAAVSGALIGVVVLFGLNMNLGVPLGIELLASGLALVLMAMHRRGHG